MMNYNSAEQGLGDDFGNAFNDKNVRMGFIRKVYGILSVQLMITFGFVCALSASDGMRAWTHRNIWLLWVSMIVVMVVIFTLACFENVRRTTPHNYIALSVFTIAEGFLVGVISSLYSYKIVITAVLITTVIVLGLTLFAFQTKIDFTVYSGILFVCVMVLMLFSIILYFWKSPIANLIYACLGALIFSAYLVVDTQMIIGGNNKVQISPEEYVMAAITLYVDIINIFMYILQILQSVSSD